MKKLHHLFVTKLSLASALFLLLALMPQWRLMAGGGFISVNVPLQIETVNSPQYRGHVQQPIATGNLDPAFYPLNAPQGIVNQNIATEIQARNVETHPILNILPNPKHFNGNVLDPDLAEAYEARGWGADNVNRAMKVNFEQSNITNEPRGWGADNVEPRNITNEPRGWGADNVNLAMNDNVELRNNQLNFSLDINYNPSPRNNESIYSLDEDEAVVDNTVFNEELLSTTILENNDFNPIQVNEEQILNRSNVVITQIVSVPQLQLADNVLHEETVPSAAAVDNVLLEEMAPSAAAAVDESAEKQSDLSMASDIRLVAFPNPTFGQFKAILEGTKGEKVQFRITSLNGQVIQVGEADAGSLQFDLSGHAAGVYSLQVLQGGQSRSVEILLRR